MDSSVIPLLRILPYVELALTVVTVVVGLPSLRRKRIVEAARMQRRAMTAVGLATSFLGMFGPAVLLGSDELVAVIAAVLAGPYRWVVTSVVFMMLANALFLGVLFGRLVSNRGDAGFDSDDDDEPPAGGQDDSGPTMLRPA